MSFVVRCLRCVVHCVLFGVGRCQLSSLCVVCWFFVLVACDLLWIIGCLAAALFVGARSVVAVRCVLFVVRWLFSVVSYCLNAVACCLLLCVA